MPRFASQMRQAGRALARRPLYAAVAVTTVAVGIAASSAAFVLLDAALLSPLPFREPERLVTADVISDKGFEISLSVPNYRDWSERSRVFVSTGASTGWGHALTGRGPARVVDSRLVLGDFFATLGLEPRLGRGLSAEDTRRHSPPIAVLGDAFFRELGGDPSLLGSALTLDGTAFTIVGVLPPGIGYPSAATEVYLPLGGVGDDLPWDDRDSSFGMRMHGRLKPDVDLAGAQADLDRVAAEIRAQEGRDVATPRLRPLAELLVGNLRQPLLLLFVAATLVVLLAVANVVNLFLARGEARRGELAVRAALGAPRWDLARLQLAEGSCIAALGGLGGVLGAAALIALFGRRVADQVPSFVAERLSIGPAAAGFALLLAAAITLVLAIVPALVLPRYGAGDALHGVRVGASRGATRFRSALVVGELALGAVLVIGATLLGASLTRLRDVEKGFDPTGVVTGRFAAPSARAQNAQQWLAFQHAVLDRVAAAPGVRSAALSLLVPLTERSWELSLLPEGVPFDLHKGDSVLYDIVSPGYFRTFGVEIVRGRSFRDSDREGSEPVTVVDETLAKKFWPGQDPIGRRVAFETASNRMHAADAAPVYRTIVGVAKNVRHYQLQNPSRIQVYVPLDQANGRWGMGLSVAIRTDGDPAPFVPLLRKLIAEVDPESPASDVAPLGAQIDRALAQPELLARTISALASLALLLAGVGVFALASFGVAQRRREIGVRQALGAAPATIVAGVLGQGLRWSTWGALIGLVAAFAAARVARSLLWGIAAFEPLAYLGPLALLASIALLACATPAARAARVDPATILRDDT